MKRLFLVSFAAAICLMISSCSTDKETTTGPDGSTGNVEVKINIGRVGTLAKTQAIEFKTLFVEATSLGYQTPPKTFELSGDGSSEEPVTFTGLMANTDWTITAKVYDTNDDVIQEGSVEVFVLPDRTTPAPDLTLQSKYATLTVTFSPLRDSVTTYQIYVNENNGENTMVAHTTIDPATYTGDAVTLTYDRLAVGERTIDLRARGSVWGHDYLLYQADTTLTVTPGEDKPVDMTLTYTGPNFPPTGQATMNVTIGFVGTTTVTGWFNKGPLDGLLLWNRLGSKNEIAHSLVGPTGVFEETRFESGTFGNAYSSSANTNGSVSFPNTTIPSDSGCIEFWAKLNVFVDDMSVNEGSGGTPALIRIYDGQSEYSVNIEFAKGITGHAGVNNSCQSGHDRFTAIFGTGKENDWHHYALVWNKQGIAAGFERGETVGIVDLFEGPEYLAVFVDGVCRTGNGFAGDLTTSGNFPLMGSSELRLNYDATTTDTNATVSRVSYDNIKIWNYSKTDFSDRSLEGDIATVPPNKMILWNKLGSVSEINNSLVGPAGVFDDKSFTVGKYGKAYSAAYDETGLVTFPQTTLNADEGCIEFWAKLNGASGDRNLWLKFLSISDNVSEYHIGFGYNGIFANAGSGNVCTSGNFDVLNEVINDYNDWHHYALVWNKQGIPGMVESFVDGSGNTQVHNTITLTVFVDGQKRGQTYQEEWLPVGDYPPMQASDLKLNTGNDGAVPSISYDNIKIWNYAKTDFSDRISE